MNLSSLVSSARRPVAAPLGDEMGYTVIGDAPLDVRMAKLFRGVTLSVHDPAAVALIRSMNTAARCGSSELCCLAAGLWGLRSRLSFVLDPPDKDRYAPYMDSIRLGRADCSSMSVAMDAHAHVSGMVVGVRTIAQWNPQTRIVEWSHVFSLAVVDGELVPCDVSERFVPVGWQPQPWRVRDSRDWMYDVAAWENWYRSGADYSRTPVAVPSRPL